MIEFFKNLQSNSIYQAKIFSELKIGGHDVLFELNYFKAKISAILKRHCCNGSCATFVKEFELFRCCFT